MNKENLKKDLAVLIKEYMFDPINESNAKNLSEHVIPLLYKHNFYNDDYENDFRPIIPEVNVTTEYDYNFIKITCIDLFDIVIEFTGDKINITIEDNK